MMNQRLEILVEESSMEQFLNGLLPRILPEGFALNENCFVYPHEGKSDLQKRLPKRVRAYQHYPNPVYLMVVQDQDSHNCLDLKHQQIKLIEQESVETRYIVRIACRELENWFLGDLHTLEKLYPKSKATKYRHKAKFRNTDKVGGAHELQKIIRTFSKLKLAREMGSEIRTQENSSVSFHHFQKGLQKLLS